MGGGTSTEDVREEYVTKSDRRMDKSAGRRSAASLATPKNGEQQGTRTDARVLGVELISAELSQRRNLVLDLEQIERDIAQVVASHTNHLSPNTS